MLPGYKIAYDLWVEELQSQKSYTVTKSISIPAPKNVPGASSVKLSKGDEVIYIGQLRGPLPTLNRFVKISNGKRLEFDVAGDAVGILKSFLKGKS